VGLARRCAAKAAAALSQPSPCVCTPQPRAGPCRARHELPWWCRPYSPQRRAAATTPGAAFLQHQAAEGCPSALPRLGALLDAQASFIALPDELLGRMLRRAWTDRPPRHAAEEVRSAAGLASVCRRVRKLLHAQPLPLALDFSAARLSASQRCWLLDRAQAGRVEAATLHSKDALWERLVLDGFLARHGGTLLRLSGVPLQLVASVNEEERPGLDLSGLRLTRLGIDCGDIRDLLYGARARRLWLWPPRLPHVWLWPARLPGALEELELIGLRGNDLENLAWAPHSSPGTAGQLLPPLQSIYRVRV